MNQNNCVGILGLGYVGLPLALRFTQVGTKVLGFDIDNKKVEALNGGESYIKHISADDIQKSLELFKATTNFSLTKDCDSLIICVPTPLTKHRDPDLSYVVSTMEMIAPYLRKGQMVSLESTTYPGTTDEVLRPIIEKQGLEIGTDIQLVYSPEREDPGNPNFTTQTIPKVVGGVTPNCLERGIKLYETIIDQVVPVSSTRAAELTKLLENIHRAVNIGLVNEMKVVADKMDIDIHEVINAAATKPFGFTAYYPGPGLGGHCIPIDPFYLTWKAREYGINTRFIELAGEVNASMPDYVTDKVAFALNKVKKSIFGSKVLILGAAYKKNIDDMRESPSLNLIELLQEKGAIVEYSDPWVPKISGLRSHDLEMKSVSLDKSTVAEYDCVIIATDHDDFDYSMILDNSKIVIDTRGKFSGKQLNNVIKA
ncbi:MAG: nucleotide sugar dehydrogenase [Bdellovibrionales bacterium]